MQKRKLKASYKSNKEVSQQTLKLLSENIDKLYDPYEFPRSTISEAAQC